MIQRGRKGITQSAAPGPLSIVQRPEPPLDLPPQESDEWRAIVAAMPGDWFPRATWPLLAQYCRHAVTARRVAQLLDAEMSKKELDLAMLDKLLQMQARETAALKAMASSMRLSQQSTTHESTAGTAKRKRTVTRLWEG